MRLISGDHVRVSSRGLQKAGDPALTMFSYTLDSGDEYDACMSNEDGLCSIESNHNRIRLDFSPSALPKSRKNHRRLAEAELPKNGMVHLAVALETSKKRMQATTYKEYVNDLKELVQQYSGRGLPHAKVHRKKWW